MKSLFRAYVPTHNKKCTMSFKEIDTDDLYNYDQIQPFSEYAGILADNVILIDIDDYNQSEILMNIVEDLQLACRVYETTRGKHFFFYNYDEKGNYIQNKNKTKCKLACGITADIKLGCRNSYSVLKYKDKDRKIIYDVFDDEDYESVPKFLLPVNSTANLLDLKVGDGRNQALFNYILTLQSHDFSVDECKKTIRLINKYILSDPLNEEELNTILREESFRAPIFFSRTGKFLFERFATYIKNNHHIININNQLHIYKDGIYVNSQKFIERQMIEHIPNLKRSDRTEVLTYLSLLIGENTPMSDAKYIAFNNGVFDLEQGILYPFSYDYIITNKIPYDYDEDSYSEITDITLDKLACYDEKIRDLLEEVIGYCFYRRNELRKSFILIGDKSNGKSTYLDMIQTLLGDDNTCALDLGELGDRFKTAELFGKLANIGDDIGDSFVPNPSVFKKVVSGDRLNAERKGKDPFDFNNYSKLLFSANDIPRIKDKSGAVINRLIIIPFNATFSPNDSDYDPYIKYKLRSEESMKYLIQIGLSGLKRVLRNQNFTVSESIQRELAEYEEKNNPILAFFKEEEKIANEPTNVIYRHYLEFCRANSFSAMSNIEFSKQVKKRLGMSIINKTISGKKYRIFVEDNL